MGKVGFNVIFTGEITPNADIETVKQKIAKSFRISREEVDAMFANTPKVIKRNAPGPICIATQKIFNYAGAICQVVPNK